MQIYLFLNGKQVGPYPVEQVQAMLGDGTLMPDTQAWHETLPAWVPVTQLVGGTAVTEEVVDEEVEIPGEGEVILRVTHQASYSRSQVLLRIPPWVLLIYLPHLFCLAFLSVAWVGCTVIAWLAILGTASYPARLYHFVTRILQWKVRVALCMVGLTDGYPSLGLGTNDELMYPLIIRQVRFSRVHGILRFFSLIYVGIPHGICLLFRQIAGIILFVVAFFAVLFTGKYPKGMHDFQVGNFRWGMRVMAYITMLSDRYPPFSGKP